MDKSEVSILLEILDLEYLKPILIDRFRNIDDFESVNLNDIGIQNQNDLNKLQYALDELRQANNSVEQYGPILSLYDCNQIITRIENETNLISSGLNLLLNNCSSNLSKDDATSDIDYSLYNTKIGQIESNIEQLQNNTEELIECVEKQYLQPEQISNEHRNSSSQFNKRTLAILTLSVFCIGLMFYIKHK